MAEKGITISVALAVYNEETNLDRCLSAVRGWADEIVVVDGGSTDGTVPIAKKFGARISVTDNPPVFHINKQKALSTCRGEWILQLDADEVVTPELKLEISAIIEGKPVENGFAIPRKNLFWGRWMRKGGLYPDYVIRLVRRGKARFPAKSVHEQIAVDGMTGRLTQPLLHYSYDSFADYWKKADRYIRLSRDEMAASRLPKSLANLLRYCLVRPLKIFFSLYIRHRGVLDGWQGLVFAYFSALHPLLAYFRYGKQVRSR